MDILVALILERIAHTVSDYGLQNGWMAFNKVNRWFPAIVHGCFYVLGFVLVAIFFYWLGIEAGRAIVSDGALLLLQWKALLVIGVTHTAIDRLSLASQWYRFYNGYTGLRLDELEPWQKAVCLQIDQGMHHFINVASLIWFS